MFAAALICAVPLPHGQRAPTSAPAPASDSVSNNSVADNTTLPSAPVGTCPPEPFMADITAGQPECLACCGPLQETSASSACAPCVPFACCSPLPCPASFKEFDQLVAGAPSYDRHVRPPPHDTPTVVALPLVPQQIGVLDTRQQRVTVELQVSFAWQDTRLRFDPSCLVERGAYTFLDRTVIWPPMLPLYVIQAESSGVWVPPVIVDNAHPNAEEFRARDEQFFIYSTGAVWYSYRASFDVKCGMDFSEMPWDTQECYVRLVAADEHSRMTLALGDIAGGDAAYYERNVYNTPQMHHLMSSTEWECTEIRGRNGTGLAGRLFASSKDYVELVFTFERRSAWYANNVVRPTILLVAISWLSFFISRTAVPARVAMTLICYLTLSNLNSMVSASLPKLSYYVRLLGLMTASQGFVFFAILEYAVANWLMRLEKRIDGAEEKARAEGAAAGVGTAGSGTKREQTLRHLPPSSFPALSCLQRLSPQRLLVGTSGQMLLRDQHLDVASRWLYPIVYAVVLGVYYGN